MPLVLKTDPTIEGLHFETGFRDAKAIAGKAIGRPCSDLAAAVAQPKFILASVEFAKNTTQQFAKELLKALHAGARRVGAELVGGHVSFSGERLALHVTAAGELLRKLVGRSGARPGDLILATGSFGGSRAGKHLKFNPRLREMLALGRDIDIHASIDISDGLALDLSRLAEASHVRLLLIRAKIPMARAARTRDSNADLSSALYDGEDYEIVFATSARDAALALQIAKRRRFALKVIGAVERGRGVWMEEINGSRTPLEPRGFVQRSHPKGPRYTTSPRSGTSRPNRESRVKFKMNAVASTDAKNAPGR